MKASETCLKCAVHESGEVTETVNESRVNPALRIFLAGQSSWNPTVGLKESTVVGACSHETTAQCCDSSFSVRVAQLVASVLISTLTSHAGLESYQSQTHLPSQRAQLTCDTCLTLHHNQHNHHNHHNDHKSVLVQGSTHCRTFGTSSC